MCMCFELKLTIRLRVAPPAVDLGTAGLLTYI